MIQFLLLLIGFIYPNNNSTMNNKHSEITIQNSINPEEGLDTGGETGTTLPPKK